MIPIHPADHSFLGVSWQGSTYMDLQLPFGLASVPAIFNAVAEALEWILRSRGVHFVIHYPDDFLLLGPPRSDECQQALLTTLATCHELGVIVASEKLEGPTTCLTFLGIEFNSLSMALKLLEGQMASLKSRLDSITGAKCIRDLHLLQSLIGRLVHACQVLPLGKAFLNHLFHLAGSMHPGHIQRLDSLVRADINWWQIM